MIDENKALKVKIELTQLELAEVCDALNQNAVRLEEEMIDMQMQRDRICKLYESLGCQLT